MTASTLYPLLRCGACGQEREHRVLGLERGTGKTSVECSTCHSMQTLRLAVPAPGEAPVRAKAVSGTNGQPKRGEAQRAMCGPDRDTLTDALDRLQVVATECFGLRADLRDVNAKADGMAAHIERQSAIIANLRGEARLLEAEVERLLAREADLQARTWILSVGLREIIEIARGHMGKDES